MHLSSEQILQAVSGLRGWEYKEGQLQKTYNLKSFIKAMEFVNVIAMLAEKTQHHPDINISYNKVTFSLSTHSDLSSEASAKGEGGVTEKDVAMAKQIEQEMINIM